MKIISLIKACMTDNMNLFKMKNKSQSKSSNKASFLIIGALILFSIGSYAFMIMESLIEIHMEFVLLTLFVLATTILTIIEGIYKSGSLLFNCKDDDLLLSLPIKKSTILFIRVFKFYVFELLYNSLFLIPAIFVYASKVSVDWSYYLVSIVAIILLPIIPIIISSIIGGIISHISSKFKLKNLVQIIFIMIFLLFVFYWSFDIQGLLTKLSENAANINDTIIKLYYPAGAYVRLVTSFNMIDLLIFILTHLVLFVLAILIFGNIYYKINSKVKVIKKGASNSEYKITSNKPLFALIKKEFKKFINTPVFVVNSAFGIVLFVFACILITLKFDSIPDLLNQKGLVVSLEQIKTYIPVLIFALICFSSLLSSITSSMISLEGKSFNILKSLPVNALTIILSKVITAVIIMLPFLLIGDLILIVRFQMDFLQIFLILISSIVMPLVSEVFGIIVNIKNPKMDAENDAEIVKQSASAMVAVLVGLLLTGMTIGLLGGGIAFGISPNIVTIMGLAFYTLVLIGLIIYLKTKGVKQFNRINA